MLGGVPLHAHSMLDLVADVLRHAPAKALVVVVPPALVSGWADTNATCEEAAVELPPALVPG